MVTDRMLEMFGPKKKKPAPAEVRLKTETRRPPTRRRLARERSSGCAAPDSAIVAILYIVSFSLFIYGLKLGTHPTSARRGNMVAAVGMAVAVVTTLGLKGIGNWGIIIGGILVGTIIGAIRFEAGQDDRDAADGRALQRARRRRDRPDRLG